MKKAMLIASFLLLTSAAADADTFRILHTGKAGGEIYVAHLLVEILAADGAVLFKGRTDSHGRIHIGRPAAGTYQVKVVYREKPYRIRLVMDGSRVMKKVYLKPI